MRYDVFIHDSLVPLAPKSGIERRLLMELIRSLGEHPFTRGDFTELDPDGRGREVKIVGRYAVSWWADHAAKEIKVTNIQLADARD